MNKKHLYTIVFLTLGWGMLMTDYGLAQQQITLKQAIDTAMVHHAALKSSKLAIQIRQQELSAVKASKIPVISSTLTLRRNLIIPSTPVPLGLIQGDASNNDITYLQFGTDWQSAVGLTMQYDIFNPARKEKLIVSENNSDMTALDYQASKGALRTAIKKAYAEAVLAGEQLSYAVQDTLLYAKDVNVADDLLAKGRLKLSDINEMRLNLSHSKSRFKQAQNVYQKALLELAYQVGFDPDVEGLFKPVDSLKQLLLLLNDEVIDRVDPTASVEYNKLKTRLIKDSLLVVNAKNKLLPTISLNAAYGTNYYENSFDLLNTNNWYGNSYVGVSVNIPLTKDIESLYSLEADRLQMNQTKYNILDYLNRKKTNLKKAMSDVYTTQSLMDQKNMDVDLAAKNLKIARSVFEKGRSLSNDLLKVQHRYEGARVDYLNAVYNYIIARLTLQDLLENK